MSASHEARSVSGGRIDHAHHYNNAYRALDETLALEEAVQAVMKEVDLTETLLVVTADHSHVLTLGGLATHRGNPIFGEPTYISVFSVCRYISGRNKWDMNKFRSPKCTDERMVK